MKQDDLSPQIIMLIGFPATGKSTYVKKFIEDYTSRSIQETAVFVCQQFPDDHKEQCIRKTIINFKKMKKWKEANLEEFCQGFDLHHRQLCPSEIHKFSKL